MTDKNKFDFDEIIDTKRERKLSKSLIRGLDFDSQSVPDIEELGSRRNSKRYNLSPGKERLDSTKGGRPSLAKSHSDLGLGMKEGSEDESDNSSSLGNPTSSLSKESEKKFIKESAAKLEQKLIEAEFFKNYSSSMIKFVFVVIFLSNVFLNVDHGSLPGCSVEIKQDLSMNDFQFGLLGSVVYGGLTLGAGVATGVFNSPKWIKPTLCLTLACNAVAIWLFTVTKSFYFDAFLRFCIGFFQVFVCIYMPVWADAFAPESQKSAWLTFLILASPLGVVGGFTLTSFMVAYKTWRWSFYLQGLGIVPCVIGFLITPEKYLDVQGTVKYKNKCAHVVQQKLYKCINAEQINTDVFGHRPTETNSMNHRHESTKQITLNPDFQIFLDSVDNDIFVGQTPVPKTKQNIMTIRQKALSKIEKLIKKESKGKDGKTSFSEEDQPFREKLKAVITNKVFVCLCMSLTGLFFVVTGIQYWTPDYLKNVLNQDDQTVSIYFSTCSLTAPVSGVIIGGIITTSYGGYNSRKAQKIQVMMGLCAMFSALPIPWMNNFYSVGILFWLLLFFGGFILPPVTGIMINSVGDYQKSSANSIANLCYNLFGFLPAPSVYGFISSVTGGSSSRWAMGVILYSTIFTISMLFYGINEKLRQEELQDEKKGSLINNKMLTTFDGSAHDRDPNDDLQRALINRETPLSDPNRTSSDQDEENHLNNINLTRNDLSDGTPPQPKSPKFRDAYESNSTGGDVRQSTGDEVVQMARLSHN